MNLAPPLNTSYITLDSISPNLNFFTCKKTLPNVYRTLLGAWRVFGQRGGSARERASLAEAVACAAWELYFPG